MRKLLLIATLLIAGCASNPVLPESTAIDQATGKIEQQADQAFMSGHQQDALYYYGELLAHQPEHRQALIRSGQLYLQNGSYDAAHEMFGRALALNEKDIDALIGTGYSELRLRNTVTAKASFQRATAYAPERWEVWNGLGIIADMETQYEQAAGYYRHGLELLPTYPPLLNNLAYSLIMAQRYNEAELLLRQALEETSTPELRLHNNLGIALAKQRKYQQAVTIVAKAYGDAVAHNNIGYIAMLNGDIETSIIHFESAMRLSPVYYDRAAVNLTKARALQEASHPVRDDTRMGVAD